MFNRLRKTTHRDYVVRYDSLDLFYRLWSISLKQREYAPKFYVHTDGTVWTSYMFKEVCFNGEVLVPHRGNDGVLVYDTRRSTLNNVNYPFVISNFPVERHFHIPVPVLYGTNCGMILRDKFVQALTVKLNLKRATHEF